MRKNWWRSVGDDGFEGELLRQRPGPSDELLTALEARADEANRRARGRRVRLGFAAATVAAMLTALASVGGLSYAATVAQGAATAVKRVVAPAKKAAPAKVLVASAGGDQYRPGFGFGDPNHNHTGPPGLQRRGGAATPPLRARKAPRGNAFLVTTNFTINEQAHLDIAVLDRTNKPLQMVQRSRNGGSTIGTALKGPSMTKFLRYAVLVPRTIPITIRVPGNLLDAGQTYRIRIVATDPDGNRTTLLIPFTAPSLAA